MVNKITREIGKKGTRREQRDGETYKLLENKDTKTYKNVGRWDPYKFGTSEVNLVSVRIIKSGGGAEMRGLASGVLKRASSYLKLLV